MFTRRSIAAGAVLGLLLSTLLVMQASGAKFVATTSNSGNSATSDKLHPATSLGGTRGCTTIPNSRWIDLSWTASTSAGVNRYRIYRSLGAGPYSSLTTVTGTTHTDSGLNAAQQYNYYVVAERSGTTWVSAATSVLSITTHGTGCI